MSIRGKLLGTVGMVSLVLVADGLVGELGLRAAGGPGTAPMGLAEDVGVRPVPATALAPAAAGPSPDVLEPVR